MGDIEEIVLTAAGYKELSEELDKLRTTERREVAERIRDAITYGELTENSEYEDAKNAQAFLEGRIEDLKHIMQIARPMENDEIPTDYVGLGSIVMVTDDIGDEWEFTLVSPVEANPNIDKISDESPVGEALFGKKVGDTVSVTVPAGKNKYLITAIRK
ncbi:MAG: transcription elongation factor GreA [Capsulimonas sp.]|uniref:transcription elongation factor GreA n=1 Tax=Capsulimonas sp. TaxID=2494211 RepID=UPI003266DBA6|nr:transcription elongation factor GreA [Capsulimonas sp.]